MMLSRISGLAIGLLSFVASAQAQVMPLPDGTTGLSPLEGRITNIEQRRVPISDTVTGSETRVSLEFTLSGCLDSLLPLVTHHEMRGRRAIIYVTALNAHNTESRTALCAAMPKATAEVSVPGLFQRNQIRVVYLDEFMPTPDTGTNEPRR